MVQADFYLVVNPTQMSSFLIELSDSYVNGNSINKSANPEG